MAIQWSGSFTSAATPVDVVLDIVSDFDRFEFYVQGDSTGSIWEYAGGTPDSYVKEALWFRGMTSGTALTTINTADAATDTKDFVTSGGFTPFSYDNFPTYPVLVTNSIAKATSIVTTTTNHGYATGDLVRIYNNAVMKQIGGMVFTITVTGATTFTIPINLNTANFSNETSANVQKLYAVSEFFPLNNPIVGITAANPAVITTARAHGYVAGSIFRVNVPSVFGMTQMNGLQVTAASVTSTTITTNIDSSAFTAFAWPAATSVPLSWAEINPIGETSSILTQAERNIGKRGMIIGSALQAPSSLSFWVASKSDQYTTSTG